MSTIELISLFTMSAVYCIAGISHLLKPIFFLKITPKWVPYPEKINIIVGIIEIFLGIALLFSLTRSYAAMGIIVLLIAVFPANIYHFQKALKKGKHVIPTLIRLPIQVLLIYWAYIFI
jgi:uncharacterized membrane protein